MALLYLCAVQDSGWAGRSAITVQRARWMANAQPAVVRRFLSRGNSYSAGIPPKACDEVHQWVRSPCHGSISMDTGYSSARSMTWSR